MDAVQNRLKKTTPAQDLGLGATEQVQNIQRASTGKAAGPVGPRASALGERQAAVQSQQALGQIAQQGRLQGLQQQQTAEAQEQAAGIASRQLEQKRQFVRDDANKKMEGLRADYSRALEEGDFARAQAAAEQASFLTRLGNEKYINELQMEGKRARLDNEVDFKKAFKEQQYADTMDLLEDNIEFKKLMAADDREFEEQLAQISAADALKILNARIEAGMKQQMYSGIGSMISGGLAAGVKMAGTSTTDTDTGMEVIDHTPGTVAQPSVGKPITGVPVASTNRRSF